MRRTHMCGEPRPGDAGAEVRLQGWVWHRRDLGGLIFVDLRDRSGAVQCVFNPEEAPEAHAVAEALRSEWVLEVTGEVTERPADTINEALATGHVEVVVREARVLARSETPPFLIEEDAGAREKLQLRYRYLDLRRPPPQRALMLRHRLAMATRNLLDERGFVEVETPILTRATPEGARDYLVPSRVHPGSFYALPQSPQLFKQLVMISGYDRYFQFARCFRDEDLRSERQPEFTQIDLEMAFVESGDVIELTEAMMRGMLEVAGHDADVDFPRLTFHEAMNRFGSDSPDLRYANELVDLTELVGDSEFRVFAEVAAAAGGAVKGLPFPGGGETSRSHLDRLGELAREQGAKGLVWIRHRGDELVSPVGKFLGEDKMRELTEAAGVGPGDVLLMVADDWEVACSTLGAVRTDLAASEGWPAASLRFVWVVEFPLLEHDEQEQRWAARHHPFTSPHPADLEALEDDPETVRSRSYDLVLNGLELGGGSIRNHDPEIQRRVFRALGMEPEESERQFGFLLEALSYGAPPHGGIALGYDRIVMSLLGEDSIRSVIPFPKTARATDLMTRAPAPVDEEQLAELHLEVRLPEEVSTPETALDEDEGDRQDPEEVR